TASSINPSAKPQITHKSLGRDLYNACPRLAPFLWALTWEPEDARRTAWLGLPASRPSGALPEHPGGGDLGGSVGFRLSGPPGLRHGCGLLLTGCQWRGICLCGN